MDVTELTLWIARFGVLVLMYLFLLALIFALRADARAATQPRQPARPTPTPAAQPPARPAAPTRARALRVTAGTPPTTGSEYSLYGPLEIGREGTCDIAIPNRFVSTHHARISPADGGWMLEDLGSTNGTLMNGQPLQSPHPLTAGDRIVVGDTEFTVQ